MITLTFSYIAICFALITAYFIWRYILYRRVTALICVCLTPGWVLVIARELKWLPLNFTTPLIALAATVGTFSVIMIVHFEQQQHKPFR